MTNCPNCGAVIDRYKYIKCPFCGTDYFDFAPMEIGDSFYIKIKDSARGQTVIANVVLRAASIRQDYEPLYAGNAVVFGGATAEINIDLAVLQDKGRLFTIVNEENNDAR